MPMLIDENICRRYFHTSNGDKTYDTRNEGSNWIILVSIRFIFFVCKPFLLSCPSLNGVLLFSGGTGTGRALLLLFSCMYSSSESQNQKTRWRFRRTRVHTSYMLCRMITDNPIHEWALFLYMSSFPAYFVNGSRNNGCIRSNIPSRLSSHNFVYLFVAPMCL